MPMNYTYASKTSSYAQAPQEFAKSYLENFNFQNSLTLQVFEKYDAKSFFWRLNSASALRKVYDSYNTIYQTKNSALQIDIWLAKIAYQEARKVLPEGFARFLNSIYEKVNKNPHQFKDFLEVFVAYHKFFNPKATN